MTIDELKQTILGWLEEAGVTGLLEGESGGISFRAGSSQVFVAFSTYGDGEDSFNIVAVTVPILLAVPVSQGLRDWAVDNADFVLFGHPVIIDDPEDGAMLVLVHRLLGDTLGKDEFLRVALSMGAAADDFDDDLAHRFGGTPVHRA